MTGYDLMTAFDKSYELYRPGGRGNGKTFIPMYSTEPGGIVEEMRKALMNESYRVKPVYKDEISWYKDYISGRSSFHSRTEELVKIGEPIDMKDQIRNFEIKKKSTKNGDAIVYSCNFGYNKDHIFTIECYEFFWLAPEVVIALFPIMWKSSTGKLIFRDHKVIAITEFKKTRILEKPDKNGNRTKTGYVSYVANCVDDDAYDPYIGAFIAISKLLNDSTPGTPNSKSEIKRLYKQIEDFYEKA